MLEKDMYQSIKKHLKKLGYEVKAEVLDADITAVKDDSIIIVEMKKTLNTTLMYQGCKRQRISDYVYLAIERPLTKQLRSKTFREKMHLVRRLQLGLMFVNINKDSVETFLDPKNYILKKNNIKKRRLLKEFEQRQTSFNTGGVTKTKIITAYRERAILIAYHLQDTPLAIKDIKVLTNDYKCASILQQNYYNWFDRVGRGIYALNALGKKELSNYSYVIDELI
ncbi:MAG: hypothetical protein KAH16_04000 [Candidatus Izimaplasma sp.]|nr:hypothetical protein [Candidatus Izimaplasma bacterium]